MELRLFLRRPSTEETLAVKQGEAHFALQVEGDVLFLLYAFDLAGAGLPWSDAPYSWHLVPAERRTLPPEPATAKTRAILQVILTDAATGIVRAMRALSLSPEFTRALFTAIRAQAEAPWCGPDAYQRQLAAAYRRYQSTEDLLAAASVRTEGGA